MTDKQKKHTNKKMTPEKKEIVKEIVQNKEMAKALATREVKKEENRDNLNHLIHLQELVAQEKLDINSVVSIDNRLKNYFNLCQTDNVMPTISGLALSLCIRREELLKWVNGKTTLPNREIVERYFSMLEVYDDTASKDGRIPTMLHIFNAKNNYGYKDKVEISTGEQEDLSDEEIERRYRELHEIVGDS